MLAASPPEHPCLEALRQATDQLNVGKMHSPPEQVRLIQFMVELTGAKRIVEIGCFTGYATLAMALALPDSGKVVTLDVNDQWVDIGRQYWRQAGVDHKVAYRSGLALESLDRLIEEDGEDHYDLAYIDADKKTYPQYFERALSLVRPGGLLLIDNVFWGGSVADPDDHHHQAETLRNLNAALRQDQRISMAMLPIGDGLTMARKLD